MELKVQLIIPEEKEIPITQLPVFSGSPYLLTPFDERTILFFDTFSKQILSDNTINRYPEIAALAFWLRKSNLVKIRQENAHLIGNPLYQTNPIGKVFHICPANVDTMFIYSMAVSLLAGNKNLLRVSNRMNAPQITALLKLMNSLMASDPFDTFKEYINVITYAHSAEISEYISGNSNARVIWGGDSTIETFKKIKAAPRTKDIVFADRISVLCLKADAYLSIEKKQKTVFAKQFFNDAYTFDQKGCSSPQSIYIYAATEAEYENCIAALQKDLTIYITSQYETDIASIASLKLNQMVDDVMQDLIDKKWGDNYFTFVSLKKGHAMELNHSCGAGYFYVHQVSSLDELKNISGSRLQTISYFGMEKEDLEVLKNIARGEGIDRIVPLGSALDFYYIWDGYNLFDELSRKVYIK